jgi:hypothetical protein
MKRKNKARHRELEFKSSPADPLGSYTGRPRDNGKPVQDADDL